MKVGEVNVRWLGNAGFLIENSAVIYVDPYQIKDNLPKADYIFLTHDHYDHCSFQDLEKIVKEGTKIIMTANCQSKATRFNVSIRMEIMEQGQELSINGLRVTAFPAYNINKHFHKKEDGVVGYLIQLNDVIIYHAGDTDFIPEMQKLTGYHHKGKTFVALLPVGGRFTMSADEAAEAAKLIKPDIAIPMHWGSVAGSIEDAQEFKEICEESGIKVKILEKE
ncbi:Zn-dependent hydrolase [Candidatus Pacearchaeota archaeon ex4484_71]|nr:MAG: Zn-dependent hydrolase [Candidatus Pacearchaeota archaeon ex4484_71]